MREEFSNAKKNRLSLLEQRSAQRRRRISFLVQKGKALEPVSGNQMESELSCEFLERSTFDIKERSLRALLDLPT